MPFIAAIIGYITKRAAIEMMFRPLRFVGIWDPFLGWQGVVPRNSARMIRTSAQLITGKLIDPQEIADRLDPDEVARQIQGPLLMTIDEIARDVMERYHPQLWEMLPVLAQDLIIKQVQAGAPVMVRKIMHEIRTNIGEVLDVEQVAVNALERDKELLVRLTRDISRPEMSFIARCGIYFGFALGVVQTFVWALTREPLILPIFGATIGWITDWLAIKLVFFPRERRRILGVFPFQGVFQRRRLEVARQYGDLVAREVMTVPNIIDGILRGPKSDRLLTMIQRIVQKTVDEQASIAKPFVAVAVGTRRFQEMKHAAADKAMTYLDHTAMQAEPYASRALDIGNTIAEKMNRLTREEYEGLLRPAFRQDEWKLIAVGAAIGALVGELQVLLLLG
ncbi:Protein of unknown function [Actinokineospora alba]|uniref:DUF445 domain-containing protein n=1 Tax=Actinokineospora alba TaxID=504798 RepID=A0A1H0STR1_9PSEU|nr:DUF445 family protein [Actinokineospora alba]TDP66547.1 uncharacterized protein DUF445 [Actinokineospora alba]SDJ37463.1 Protein of unknown function [Actinokineospora alba]SDP45005.1 Protein of unknown function [Actinokineospora alba]